MQAWFMAAIGLCRRAVKPPALPDGSHCTRWGCFPGMHESRH